MKIIQLSEAEAANPTIVALVAKHLFDGALNMLADAPRITNDGFVKNSLQIAAADRPDTGFPPDQPLADKQIAVPKTPSIDPTTLGFGTGAVAAAPTMVLPFPGATVPVAASLVSAPAVAAVPSTPVAATGPEVDKHGLPWDARIHSGGENKKNADGSWRKKRGVDDAVIAMVEAEMRQILAVPALAAAPIAQVQLPLPPTAAAIPAPPAEPAITFDAWMKELTGAMTKNLVTTELFNTMIQRGYPGTTGVSMSALVMRPELIPPVRAALAAHLDQSHPGWRELQS